MFHVSLLRMFNCDSGKPSAALSKQRQSDSCVLVNVSVLQVS